MIYNVRVAAPRIIAVDKSGHIALGRIIKKSRGNGLYF